MSERTLEGGASRVRVMTPVSIGLRVLEVRHRAVFFEDGAMA